MLISIGLPDKREFLTVGNKSDVKTWNWLSKEQLQEKQLVVFPALCMWRRVWGRADEFARAYSQLQSKRLAASFEKETPAAASQEIPLRKTICPLGDAYISALIIAAPPRL